MIKSFTNYILDKLVYVKEPKPKHAKRIAAAQDRDWFKVYAEDAPVELYPANSSDVVKAELLNMSTEQATTRKPGKLEHKYDDDFLWAFKELVESNGGQWPTDYFKDMVKVAADRTIRLKYKYNRPRPFQLAPYHDVDMTIFGSGTAKTPSFPSGHTAQSRLVAKVVADKYPELKEEAMKIANDISKSRVVGGHHFMSDIKFGEKIGDWLHANLVKPWKK